MLIKTKFLPKECYSEEGFFDPIKNVFNSIKDKFNKDINFSNSAASIEKDLQNTYLSDVWLDRRVWVKPNARLVIQAANLLAPEVKQDIFSNAAESIQETNDFIKFINQHFRAEIEFSQWVDNSGWRKSLRQIYQFSRTLKTSYGQQDIPKFNSRSKIINVKTDSVDPVLDYTAFKTQTQEVIELCKLIDPSKKAVYNNHFIQAMYEWDKDLYEYIREQVREDFTEETEYFDSYQNRTIITQRLVHEEEYLLVIDSLRRLNECFTAAKEMMNSNLSRPCYYNVRNLREAMYRQLRGSFTK